MMFANGAVLLGIALLAFAGGCLFCSRFLGCVVGIDLERKTPAVADRDDVDYVPAHPLVLFGHHFAAIAGAGPIVGPVFAVEFGWGAVALWLLFMDSLSKGDMIRTFATGFLLVLAVVLVVFATRGGSGVRVMSCGARGRAAAK